MFQGTVFVGLCPATPGFAPVSALVFPCVSPPPPLPLSLVFCLVSSLLLMCLVWSCLLAFRLPSEGWAS